MGICTRSLRILCNTKPLILCVQTNSSRSTHNSYRYNGKMYLLAFSLYPSRKNLDVETVTTCLSSSTRRETSRDVASFVATRHCRVKNTVYD